MDKPALLLPKGIVANSVGLAEDIERRSTEPLDLAEIARFWRVYTTTKRRLLDPTAERLENYWWRIWGSNRRELNSGTVARLFAFISDGNSFTPLRGPPNRDEGGTEGGLPPMNSRSRQGPGASSTTAIHRQVVNKSSKRSSPPGRPSGSVQPPAGILKGSDTKKTRAASTTGPKLQVEFVEPSDESQDDAFVSPNSHVVVQPPSPVVPEAKSDKKVTTITGKKQSKFTASTSRKVAKRPTLIKRKSSQSSTDSPSRPLDATGLNSSSDKTPPTFDHSKDRGKQRSGSKFQENFSTEGVQPKESNSTSKRSRTPDPKLRVPHKSTSGTRKGKVSSSNDVEPRVSAEAGPSGSNLRPIENDQAPEELTEEELQEIEMQRLLLAEANARLQKKITPPQPKVTLPSVTSDGFQILHKSLRSRSDGQQDSGGALRHIRNENKSAAVLAPTLTDATGQLASGRQKPPSPRNNDKVKGKGRDASPIFTKRPVQPVAPTSVPDSTGSLSRSKSQLTLLLEKDRTRTSENESRDDKGKKR